MNKSMFEIGLEIRGIKLRVDELVQISNFYNVACTQEFIMENYNVSAQDAKSIASIVREKIDSEESNEGQYIVETAKKLGITLS